MVVHDIDLSYSDKESLRFLKLVKPRKASSLESKVYWQKRTKQEPSLPSYFDATLDDHTLAFSPRADSALVRSRVNTILFSIVSAVKRMHEDMASRNPVERLDNPEGWEDIEDSENSQDSAEIPEFGSIECLRLSVGQPVTFPDYSTTSNSFIRAIADEIVWYGDVENLDAILVVHETTSFVTTDNILLPPAMLMIHWSRCLAEKKPRLYGIVTNSYQWCFVKMESNNKYFQTILDWRNEAERSTMIGHLRYIIGKGLSLLRGRPGGFVPLKDSVSSLAECEVWYDLKESKRVDRLDG